MQTDIQTYHKALAKNDKTICDLLKKEIDNALPKAESKVWHGHPVWFLEGNPVVGYSKRKNEVQLLFWSGQSFDEPHLLPEGSFKAADAHYTDVSQIHTKNLTRWLKKSIKIQWDYKNIVKRRGVLKKVKPW